jgi:PAT family beta-lactamase induction signal transducer AmpG
MSYRNFMLHLPTKKMLPHMRSTHNPLRWVPTVYFAMGVPFVALNMVSVLMFKSMDISDAQIAFWTSLIMLPWTLKPLWNPPLGMSGV